MVHLWQMEKIIFTQLEWFDIDDTLDADLIINIENIFNDTISYNDVENKEYNFFNIRIVITQNR